MTNRERSADRAEGAPKSVLFERLSLVIPVLLFLLTFPVYLPDNPVKLAMGVEPNHRFLPEGWGFFTRDPRESQTLLYRIHKNQLESINLRSGIGFQGFDRRIRSLRMEAGAITEKLEADAWHVAEVPSLSDLDLTSLPSVELRNTAKVRRICGEILMAHFSTTPWAWSKLYGPRRFERWARVSVSC